MRVHPRRPGHRRCSCRRAGTPAHVAEPTGPTEPGTPWWRLRGGRSRPGDGTAAAGGRRLLFAFRDHAELALAAIALWWACLPWLALTGRLTAWGHATWALAANAAATGLVYLAWLVTSSGLSPLRAVGAWVLWVAAAAAAVLFLAYAREVAGVERGPAASARHARLSPRPALSAMWLVGGAAAVALALLVQPGSASSPAAGSGHGRQCSLARAERRDDLDPVGPCHLSTVADSVGDVDQYPRRACRGHHNRASSGQHDLGVALPQEDRDLHDGALQDDDHGVSHLVDDLVAQDPAHAQEEGAHDDLDPGPVGRGSGD